MVTWHSLARATLGGKHWINRRNFRYMVLWAMKTHEETSLATKVCLVGWLWQLHHHHPKLLFEFKI